MVSNVNSDSSNLLQLLLSAAKSSAQSATATSSSASSSETGIGSVSSSDSTQSDFLTFLQDNFNSIDSDKDSAISQKELDTYLEKNKSPMGPPPGLIIEDASSVGSASGNELEAVSSVSDSEESESTEAKQKVFDDLDTNKDGVVSQKEIEEHLQKTQTADSNSSGGTASDTSDSKAQDVMTTLWSKLNSPATKSLFENMSHKLAETYKTQGFSSNFVSTVLDKVI